MCIRDRSSSSSSSSSSLEDNNDDNDDHNDVDEKKKKIDDLKSSLKQEELDALEEKEEKVMAGQIKTAVKTKIFQKIKFIMTDDDMTMICKAVYKEVYDVNMKDIRQRHLIEFQKKYCSLISRVMSSKRCGCAQEMGKKYMSKFVFCFFI